MPAAEDSKISCGIVDKTIGAQREESDVVSVIFFCSDYAYLYLSIFGTYICTTCTTATAFPVVVFKNQRAM